MSVASDPKELFSAHTETYLRFIHAAGYPRALHNFFLSADFLRSRQRVLDAGCGSGVLCLSLLAALEKRGITRGKLDAFDLTPAMLERFRDALLKRGIDDITLRQANVMELDSLPQDWRNYDLIITGSMLEYLPRERLPETLSQLSQLLAPGGRMLLFITRRNVLMRHLIGRWWQANLYDRFELETAFTTAGVEQFTFHRFTGWFRYLNLWGHIVEAHGGTGDCNP